VRGGAVGDGGSRSSDQCIGSRGGFSMAGCGQMVLHRTSVTRHPGLSDGIPRDVGLHRTGRGRLARGHATHREAVRRTFAVPGGPCLPAGPWLAHTAPGHRAVEASPHLAPSCHVNRLIRCRNRRDAECHGRRLVQADRDTTPRDSTLIRLWCRSEAEPVVGHWLKTFIGWVAYHEDVPLVRHDVTGGEPIADQAAARVVPLKKIRPAGATVVLGIVMAARRPAAPTGPRSRSWWCW